MTGIVTIKQLMSVVAFGLLIGAASAQAATIGNPAATTPAGGFKLGLDAELNERDYEDEGETINFKTQRYQLRGAVGITGNIEVFAKVGMGSLEIDDVDDFDDGIVYGGGVKATVYSVENFKIGLTAQITAQNNDYTYEESGILYGYGYSLSQTVEVDITEIELAAGVSYQIGDIFVPYAGVVYSDAQADADAEVSLQIPQLGYSEHGTATASAEGKDSVGAFVGADINVNSHFSLALEGRFIHETSYSLLANFTF